MSDTPRITESELLDLSTRALVACGMPEDDARDASRILVLADLFGIGTHGVSRVESYGERLRMKGINPRPNIGIQRTAASVVLVDGDNGVGPLVGMRALHAAMAAAKETGMAGAFARASNHFGPIASYAYIAAQEGFASIIGTNATTTISPTGGRDTRVGNNPLGLCVPCPGGDPVILDMAMSVVARAKIRDAVKRGESIPNTWATDRNGHPTTDPKAALEGFLAPVGGYKGYGLAVMVDLFAGLLSGAAYLTHVKSWVDEPEAAQNLGHFFLLIDTTKSGLGADLAERIADFRSILHDTPPANPAQPVLLPGEIEMTRFNRQRRDGIAVDPKSLAHLRSLIQA